MSQQVARSVRKRKATRDRIADAAAQLVGANGLAKTTVEQIASAAGIGRATFFRYFSSKEDAVSEGMTRRWLDLITAAIADQPPGLSAPDAVLAAFADLAAGFAEISDQIKELATLTRSSPTLNAWTLQIYVGYENAIAELIAPRLSDPPPDDPRPRLIGALAMTSVRIALDDWLRHGGSLPDRVHRALTSVSFR
ncbi:TetR family transcriptional regulator [Mycolicibacter kumamotonensis]|uniref:TetR family transcriptional regulator n=1 Tax=Mycolicibacter kumamotonensis TaxID=354243 RepID=A0A7K3L6V9_9MYCO|nr:TetR family transcriptional regulator [Mycolicibacter kumamotonensis]NDJ87913.1 TetR family transcriptional regulator [Mycolicibacter kumamotonensis]